MFELRFLRYVVPMTVSIHTMSASVFVGGWGGKRGGRRGTGCGSGLAGRVLLTVVEEV